MYYPTAILPIIPILIDFPVFRPSHKIFQDGEDRQDKNSELN